MLADLWRAGVYVWLGGETGYQEPRRRLSSHGVYRALGDTEKNGLGEQTLGPISCLVGQTYSEYWHIDQWSCGWWGVRRLCVEPAPSCSANVFVNYHVQKTLKGLLWHMGCCQRLMCETPDLRVSKILIGWKNGFKPRKWHLTGIKINLVFR